MKSMQHTSLAKNMNVEDILISDFLTSEIRISSVKKVMNSVADPGFSVGGCRPRKGGFNSRGGYVWNFLYVKTKEGRAPDNPLDPPMELILFPEFLNRFYITVFARLSDSGN